MNLGHSSDDLVPGGCVSDTPPCHGVGFGKASQHNGVILHPGQAGKAGRLHVIDEQVVDLVGDDQQFVPPGYIGYLGQSFHFHYRPGGIGRVANEDGFGSWRDGSLNVRGRQPEVILTVGGNLDGHAVGKKDACRIGHVGRIGHDHFVSRVDDGPHCQVESLADTAGDEELGIGIVVQIVGPLEVGRQFLAQFQHPRIGGVHGEALLQ